MKRIISVCGSDESDDHLSRYALETAENVGRFIARRGGVVVCGGRGGIMRAVCKGAKEENAYCQNQKRKRMNLLTFLLSQD